MKMHHFVSGSAVVIAGWLMVTFLHDVSPQQYPQQRRGVPTRSANRASHQEAVLSQNASSENPIGPATASGR
jgi:hypothetical protein